jgi:hypothetical protein
MNEKGDPIGVQSVGGRDKREYIVVKRFKVYMYLRNNKIHQILFENRGGTRGGLMKEVNLNSLVHHSATPLYY